ncbi:peroxisomal membrane protein pex14 [Entophlyctis luteolus]|nr:peroxisomal membrane protein pex14 [Entophlyctis luteolus]
MAKRIAFLESKGLTQAEINEAIAKTSYSATTTATTSLSPATGPPPPVPDYPSPVQYAYAQPQPPAAPQRDWRDYTLGLIGAVGFAYGAFHIFQNYIVPNLSWPESPAQKEERQRLESISVALAEATKLIQDQNAKLQEVMDANALEQERNAEEVRQMRDDLDSLKKDLPALVKSSHSESFSISEIQTEIKSLKNLLLNRNAFPPIPSTGKSIPPPLAYQSTSSNAADSLLKRLSDNSSSDDDGHGTKHASPIPSWQLPAPTPKSNGTPDLKSSLMNSKVTNGSGDAADE